MPRHQKSLGAVAPEIVTSVAETSVVVLHPELQAKMSKLAQLDGKTLTEFTNAALLEWMETTGDLLLEFKRTNPSVPILDNIIEFVPRQIEKQRRVARVKAVFEPSKDMVKPRYRNARRSKS
jgi:hypothetical protein